ncbi:GH92 family glycosyl hydrolase [Myceligenerans pegani]|uniref:GH92 family glycosyl hydrolase n=1 Tax=Myceligenerans pegani TaxID=2776917 RepID=A0ABR9MXB6_9MICO|nr:GH92 family glycosyl hydrolase [Myceligenerans sp. TRM 65318]MBE1876035.1 GH92 family glycosyl hydrolase [Myceligenerans sp. TRM 65318]MBE3018306.1 GH92 family glycosyl hydrolase [Myceligenerans sp. TRM 65318]
MSRVPTRRHRRRGVLSASVALALIAQGTAGFVAPAGAAAAPGDFTSSFEESDAVPLESTPAERDGEPWHHNVGEFVYRLPGSILDSVSEATASGENLPNEGVDKIVDAEPSTKWLVFEPTGWVTYELSEPTSVVAYSLTSANDFDGRDPQAWTLQGSSDGETWADIDQRAGVTFPERFERQVFELDAPSGEFRYFRLDVTENHGDPILQIADWDLSVDLTPPETSSVPMTTAVGDGPESASWTSRPRVGFDGLRALRYSGSHLADGPAYATNVLYDDVDIAVGPDTRLSYKIFPELLRDLAYPSTYAAMDLRFTDGTFLSELGAEDSHGTAATAAGQGAGKILYADQWNSVRVDVGAVAEGRTIDQILVGYDNDAGEAGTLFSGWLDDVAVEASPEVIDGSSHLNFVDTRRGTHSSGGFSRGNNIPATAVPNGFNFYVPMTNAATDRWLYEYQTATDDRNRPVLEGIGISHEPSPWMGDRNQLAFQPAVGAGTPDAGLDARGLPFDHDDETARPDYYGVEFADGQSVEVAPADHSAVLRFGFPADAADGTGHVLVDQVLGESSLDIDAATGTLSGWVEGGSGLSVGRTRMYVAGTFDRAPTTVGQADGDREAARYATFDVSQDDTVELRVATSFIGLEQARANLGLEVADRSFEEVRADAAAQWEERLSVIEVEGASEDELVTLYSNLYRLNLYPNSQFENTGTAEEPRYRYASPVSEPSGEPTDTETNARIVDGKIYVNNGFWDTYRTAWPAYSFLYPDLAAELVDGFVQQYRDGGWVARWSSPGYADLMTGTSSDVAFADAYLKGSLPTEQALDAYDAALKNATVAPTSSAVGRKGLEVSPYLGFTPESTHESVSWGLEGLINDFGIGNMAKALSRDREVPRERRKQLREESRYFLERATHYVGSFNPETEFFATRHADGEFVIAPEDYDPRVWGNGYTETSGWNFAFHAPQDPNGLANLYGGTDGLEAKLDEFFATPEEAKYTGSYNGVIHEMREARDVRLGQWGMSNQVSHHIPWLYDAVGAPHKTQEIVREVMRRLFVGSEIGQGYPGDEDNGEMSSWWIFAALGFYPLQVGSAEYAVGSPLFEKATVHLPDGDLVINAHGNSDENVYVQSLRVDGRRTSSTSLSQKDLSGGARLDFVMGSEPSGWGTGRRDALPSLTGGGEPPEPVEDVTPSGTVVVDDGTTPHALVDDTSATRTGFSSATPTLTWEGDGERPDLVGYTLTSGEAGTATPSAWRLEGSNDGRRWRTLDERSGEEFRWARQLRPFEIDRHRDYAQVRLVIEEVSGAGELALAEFELLAEPDGGRGHGHGPGHGHGRTADTAATSADLADDVEMSAVPQCTDGAAALTVVLGNTGDTAATVAIESDLGAETVTLKPGDDRLVTLEPGITSFGAGAVAATVSGAGPDATPLRPAVYAQAEC